MKVVVTGGGTGGHIYPALALIKEIERLEPGSECLYIGTEQGLESDIVPRSGTRFETITISGFQRSLTWKNARTIWRFWRGTKKAKQMLTSFGADIVIGTGGYVAGPVVFAASKLDIPTVIHEQNSIPGLTNKFLSRFVDNVAVSIKDSAAYFPASKVRWTGNPRASEVSGVRTENPLPALGLDPHKKTVLIVGGSRGAKPINDSFLEALPETAKKEWQYLYVTGTVHYDKVIEETKKAGNPDNVIIQPFIHHMPEVLAFTDLLISRAGATTLAEITALGVPSILIPSPHVTNNHQEKNAESLSRTGGAVVYKENEWNGTALLYETDAILSDEKRWETMHEAAKTLAAPDAAADIFRIMQHLMQPSGCEKEER
ncbi:undecaprenyldiphospho-muramoylpentapeptide beta-N-acetylglucosaminyltransferase [Salibacterium qingdaonense]|uniref:UDP-N-acetylglucosamine--N-acetylmuramyl-(pentapeptide) pyrophosphoryl-undecaprenol N-acetylglucosamine transferase n=1 Tax=Salibacterium qingdaonense TaxID=266892 RepID=A0A1I4IWT6_9BACI|nr:undecaprenyldiphospho-muramoylpentapeptide beta-N-acetylglucosaminyltransferase [Salibacterium qingdaonense]SFL58774.1 UDP-N-acetylglucosamine-N-acetylmuramylpentapeptide N-acetylglucosamine transferase [Salibacterium qingdaonense]